MQGKKTRENPLAEGILNATGAQPEDNQLASSGGGGFGQQQQFQLKAYYGEAARAKDEEAEEEGEGKKELPKKEVRHAQ
jgi:hypothetical protein